MSSAPRLNKPITVKKVILQASRSTGYPMKSKSTFGKFLLGAALCAATVLLATSPTHAALIFTENFNYPISDNLAGKNGGTGFSGAWSGGNSTIVAGLGGTPISRGISPLLWFIQKGGFRKRSDNFGRTIRRTVIDTNQLATGIRRHLASQSIEACWQS
jgi:hypothetical protein